MKKLPRFTGMGNPFAHQGEAQFSSVRILKTSHKIIGGRVHCNLFKTPVKSISI